MKKSILFFTVLVALSVFLAGCGVQEYATAKQAEKEAYEHLEEFEDKMGELTEETAAQQPATYEVEEEDEVIEAVSVETNTGSTASLTNKGDYRDVKVGEACDFDYPFSCSEYIAREGSLYLDLKYNGYPSKIEEIELSLDGDYCDPSGSYMEPGTVKRFTCYLPDPDASSFSGDFEIKYYHNIDHTTKLKTGSVTVKNI